MVLSQVTGNPHPPPPNMMIHGEFPNSRSTKQQKMKNWYQTAEYFFMLQSLAEI